MPNTYTDFNISFTTTSVDDVSIKIDIDSINQSIKNILLTKKGELICNPQFGSKIHTFLFEKNSSIMKFLIEDEVRISLDNWEPRINVTNVYSETTDAYPNILDINIEYTVLLTNETTDVTIQVGLR